MSTRDDQHLPIIEIILLCIKPELTADEVKQLRQVITAGIDWKQFHFRIRQGQVQVLAYTNLMEHCKDLLSEHRIKNIQVFLRRRLHLSMKYFNALYKLVTAASEQGVTVVSYKGPTLAYQAYGAFHLRTFVDIDVIVHEGDLLTVDRILTEQGYRPTQPVDLTSAAHRQAKHYVYKHPEDDVSVEVHWRLKKAWAACKSMDVEGVITRSIELDIQGITYRVPSLEDNLVVLASHGNQHLWSRIIWISDVANLLKQYDVDWDLLLQRAEATASRRVILLALYICQELFKIRLPQSIQQMIDAERFLQTAGNFVLTQIRNYQIGEVLFHRWLFLIYMEECWRTRPNITLDYFKVAYQNRGLVKRPNFED